VVDPRILQRSAGCPSYIEVPLSFFVSYVQLDTNYDLFEKHLGYIFFFTQHVQPPNQHLLLSAMKDTSLSIKNALYILQYAHFGPKNLQIKAVFIYLLSIYQKGWI